MQKFVACMHTCMFHLWTRFPAPLGDPAPTGRGRHSFIEKRLWHSAVAFLVVLFGRLLPSSKLTKKKCCGPWILTIWKVHHTFSLEMQLSHYHEHASSESKHTARCGCNDDGALMSYHSWSKWASGCNLHGIMKYGMHMQRHRWAWIFEFVIFWIFEFVIFWILPKTKTTRMHGTSENGCINSDVQSSVWLCTLW